MKPFTKTVKQTLALLILLALDLSLLTGACLFAFWLRFEKQGPFLMEVGTPDLTSYRLALFLAIYLVLAQMAAFNLYAIDRFRTWKEDYYGIIRAVTFATGLLLSLSFFYRKVQFSRQMVMMAWPLAIISMCVGRSSCRAAIDFFRIRGLMMRRVLIYGEGAMLPVLLEKIAGNKALGLKAIGMLHDIRSESALPTLGKFSDLEKVVVQHDVKIVFLAQEELAQEKILEIIEICERLHVELFLIPQIFDLLIGQTSLRDLQGLPMMELREEPVLWGTLFLKRLIDLLLGSFLFLLSLPLQAILMILIRLDSKGPIFFKQERVGYRGKIFCMWKFRSMIPDAEERLKDLVNFSEIKEPVFKLHQDPRVTRLGNWLRRTSLDELPQLWNVIIGQMSLVGPRPEEVEMVKRYSVWQRRRLKIKPGITGLQQIKCRGTASLSERVKYDIYYIRRLSLLLDFEILIKTIWVVLSQKGAS